MGRHRRATPAAAEYAPAASARQGGARHRGAHGAHRKRSATPVRTGLLGASAAVAMGAVAVASGLIPGPGGGYTVGDAHGPADQVRADGPGGFGTQGGSGSPTPSDRGGGTADRDTERPAAPSGSGDSSRSAGDEARDDASPKPSRTDSAPEAGDGGGGRSPDGGETESGRTESASPDSGDGERGGRPDAETAAETQVLALVNKERAQAGCKPVTADPELAAFAENYSEDMARRGFFSHTTPEGKSPWDRAEDAGIDDLGGENIARGQSDAQAVMESWMDSPGHRENILNCDYRTMGVGAHFAEGGPWWTQNFGF